MQTPYLQMQSTLGQIGLQSNRPPLQIKQPNADLTIKQEHVDTLKISTKASKLLIDQTEAFADAHLKDPIRSANEYYQKTKSKVAEYISKTVSQGMQLLKIENGGNVFPQLAAANSQLNPERQFQLKSMPNALRVKINYQPGELNIQVNRSEPDIQVKKNDPIISIPKWQTDAYIRQKNNLNIQAVGLSVNIQQ